MSRKIGELLVLALLRRFTASGQAEASLTIELYIIWLENGDYTEDVSTLAQESVLGARIVSSDYQVVCSKNRVLTTIDDLKEMW